MAAARAALGYRNPGFNNGSSERNGSYSIKSVMGSLERAKPIDSARDHKKHLSSPFTIITRVQRRIAH